MALKLDYVLRETATNLRRNLLMSTAAILTVAVSLSLVGGALLLKQGVANATMQWRGGVELSVWMKNDAPQQQIDAVRSELDSMPEVKSAKFVDKPAAYEEAKTLFQNQPDILDNLNVDAMPPSFRIVPTKAELIPTIKHRFEREPGVLSVTDAKEQVQSLLTVTRVLQVGFLIVAVVLLISATLLILNTIRIAIFARRREVAVMKLVGATNWFIRIPFMLEGLLQGLLGAAVAFVVVISARIALANASQNDDFKLIHKLIISPGEAVGIGLFVLAVGAVVGVLGSIAAVHRFLET
jgi:cell division transport system permease protein